MNRDSQADGILGLSRELRMLRSEARWLRRLATVLVLCDVALLSAYIFARDALRFWVE